MQACASPLMCGSVNVRVCVCIFMRVHNYMPGFRRLGKNKKKMLVGP